MGDEALYVFWTVVLTNLNSDGVKGSKGCLMVDAEVVQDMKRVIRNKKTSSFIVHKTESNYACAACNLEGLYTSHTLSTKAGCQGKKQNNLSFHLIKVLKKNDMVTHSI